MHQTGPSINTH